MLDSQSDTFVLIPLKHEMHVVVDADDFDLVKDYTWHAACYERNIWYAATNVTQENGKRTLVLMHRIIMCATPEQKIDHKNNVGLDNRRENLRLATTAQNNQNRCKRLVSSSSQHKGVNYKKNRSHPWRAYKHIYVEDISDATLPRSRPQWRMMLRLLRNSGNFHALISQTATQNKTGSWYEQESQVDQA